MSDKIGERQDKRAQRHKPEAAPNRKDTAPQHPSGFAGLGPLIGNRALGYLIQAKLRVGEAGDAFEQEADRVAEQVMRMPDPASAQSISDPATGAIAGLRPQSEVGVGRVLRRAQTDTTGSNLDAFVATQGEGGQTLDPAARAFFEPRLGHDLSGVRIHTGRHAAESAQAVNARAYTVGRDVVFNRDQYAPHSTSGRCLLAHELTHVIQQGQAPATTPSHHLISRTPASAPRIQRALSVDPARFPATGVSMNMTQFKHYVSTELSAVTGLTVEFAANDLAIRPGGSARSATAERVLRMAVDDPAQRMFIDPEPGIGATPIPSRGMSLGTDTTRQRLQALRAGIIIVHELIHHFASAFRSPDYEARMRALIARQERGETLTTEAFSQITQYRAGAPFSEENVPVDVSNLIRQELGMGLRRIAYEVRIAHPPAAASSGTEGPFAGTTAYTQFLVEGASPASYIYQRIPSGELFWSHTDYTQALVRRGRFPAPSASEFQPIESNTALRRFLL